MHTERGIAKLAGIDTTLLPPPTGNLQQDYNLRVKILLNALPKHDCFYIHLKGPDEPGHDGNCELKTQIITAVDKYFFGPLLKQISPNNTIICITTDHATPCDLKVHSDTPVPLLISNNTTPNNNNNKEEIKFCEKQCTKGSLGIIEHAHMLMPKLIEQCKK
jgi:2,3-bisphosphoglycerate-independent phosphoglycerate mutase